VRETALRIEDYPPRPESPYETRWPGERLPRYFERPFFLRQHSYPLRGCFVHVGKTAGSSVGCAVGFQLHCRRELRHPRGYLPRLTARLLHSDVNDCTAEEDYYLFSVRDPLERIQSWYVYEEKKLQELYANCSFPTLNDLAERGLETYKKHKERVREASGNASLPMGADSLAATSASRRERNSLKGSGGSRRGGYDDDDGEEEQANSTIRDGDDDKEEEDLNAASATVPPPRPLASVRCRFKARRVIRGTEKIGSHAYYNYARYMTQIPDGAAVGVIRTPHLVQDWNSMEAYLTERVRQVEKQAGRAADDNTQKRDWPSSRNPLASLWTPRRPDPPPVQISRLGSKNRTPRRAAEAVTNETGASALATEVGIAAAGFQGDERRHLSPLARELVCEALCDEIQVYKRILRRAVNLAKADVRESLDELRRACPREADLPGACLY
jgi:hypothetical protein